MKYIDTERGTNSRLLHKWKSTLFNNADGIDHRTINLDILWMPPAVYSKERLAWVFVIFFIIICLPYWLSSISSNGYNDDGVGDNIL